MLKFDKPSQEAFAFEIFIFKVVFLGFFFWQSKTNLHKHRASEKKHKTKNTNA